MSGGREEEQAGGFVRMAQAEGGGDRAAEGMADDDRLFDAALLHQSGDCICLAGGDGVLRTAAFGIAMTGAIDEQHFRPAFECGAEGHDLVEQIAAGAVNEDQSRQIRIFWRRDVDRIHAVAADIGQFADIRIGVFKLPRLISGVTDGGGERGEKSGNFCKHDLNKR